MKIPSCLVLLIVALGVPSGRAEQALSGPLPAGNWQNLLHLGANFDTDHLYTTQGSDRDVDFLDDYGGEANQQPYPDLVYNLATATTGDNNLTWTAHYRADGWWQPVPNQDNYVKYWHIYIIVPGATDRDVRYHFRYDDDIRMWVNGTLMVAEAGYDGGNWHTTDGTLFAGMNAITIKLREGTGGDHMAMRVTDRDDEDYNDLTFSLFPADFTVDAGPATPVGETTATLNGELVVIGSPPDEVLAVWATNDWLEDLGDWETHGHKGSLIDPEEGPISLPTANLSPDTVYHYRFLATNETHEAWSDPVTFKTLGGTPTVNHDGGVTGLAAGRATLNGALTAGSVADIWIYSGPSAGNWTRTNLLEDVAEGPFSVEITDLPYDQPWRYQCFASNVYGTAWAPTATDFTTTGLPFSTWGRKMEITFDGYTGSSTLTDFPALIVLNTDIEGFYYDQFLSGDYDDLRFTDSTGETPLDFEIDTWNKDGDSLVWVRLPTLSNNDTIWAYWNKADVTAPPSTTDGSVWDSGFAAVWHLNEDDPSATYTDSTANNNHGTPGGDPETVAGRVGQGKYFDDNDWMESANNIPISGSADRTVSLWIKRIGTDVSGDYFKLGDNSQQRGAFALLHYSNDARFSFWADWYEFRSSQSIAADQWYHVAGRYSADDGNYVRLYVNGVEVGQANTHTLNTQLRTALIGHNGTRSWQNGLPFHADEVRVSSVLRSADWIMAEYRNMGLNADFMSYGEVQAVDADMPVIQTMPPAAVAATSVDAVGTLLAEGSSAATVYVVFDTRDWGAGDGWAHTNIVADPGTAGTTYTTTLDLTAGHSYYYRFAAANDSGWSFGGVQTFITAPVTITREADAQVAGPLPGTFRLHRATTATNFATVVSYAVTGGSAASGVNYTALSGSVTIPAGSTTADITVTPLLDRTDNTTKALDITVQGGGLYPVGAPSSATMSIVADPLPPAGLELIWDNATGNMQWDQSSLNWHLEGYAPGTIFFQDGDSVTFWTDGGGTVSLNGNQAVHALYFGAPAMVDVPSFTISGNTLTLGAGGIHFYSKGGNSTINSAITLSAPSTIASYSGWPNERTFTLGGAIDNAGHALTLHNPGVRINVNQAISGSGPLRVSGTGAIHLNADNPLTGPVTIAGRAIMANSTARLASIPSVAVADGGNFQIGGTGASLPDDGTTTFGRIPSDIPFAMYGSAPQVYLVGQNNTVTTERIGELVLKHGLTRILIESGTDSTASLIPQSATRGSPGRPVCFVYTGNRYNLGSGGHIRFADDGASLTRIGGDGSRLTNKQIVPWMFTRTQAAHGTHSRVGGMTDMVYYDPVNGLTQMNPANDYVNADAIDTFPSVNGDGNDNVRLPFTVVKPTNEESRTITLTADIAVNALLLYNDTEYSNAGTLTIAGSGRKLTVKSGLIMGGIRNSANRFGANFTVSQIDFGAAEGILAAPGPHYGGLTVSSALLGSQGLTVYVDTTQPGEGRVQLAGDNSGLSGTYTLIGGPVHATHTNAFGDGSRDLVLSNGQLHPWVSGNLRVASLSGLGTIQRIWNAQGKRLDIGDNGTNAEDETVRLLTGGSLKPGFEDRAGTIEIRDMSHIKLLGGTLEIDLVIDGGSDQLFVSDPGNRNPTVQINGTSLVIGLHAEPVVGTLFRIVHVQGPNAVTGQFVEGELVEAEFEGVNWPFVVHYNADIDGDQLVAGNSIILEAQDPAPRGSLFLLR